MNWEWNTSSHKKVQNEQNDIKKLKDEWVWNPIKLGPGQSYGGHQVGELFEDGSYPCGFCNGKGQKPRGSMCPVCKGSGTVSVEPPAVRCAYCKGKGEDKPRGNVTCSACKGMGVIHVEQPVETCSHCRGTGKEPTNKLVCIKCRGKGVVTVKEEKYDLGEEIVEIIGLKSDEKEKTIGSASGSERDALNIIKSLGHADTVAISRRMSPPVSPAYAKQLCDSLFKKRLVLRQGLLYSPNGKTDSE